MTVSLVTGHAGTNHITSAQIGGFQSKYYGHGIVRLPDLTYNDVVVPDAYTNEADAISWPRVTVSGTTATIPAGMWLVNGRLVAIDAATTIEVPSHSSGSGTRKDTLQFKFTVNDDGTETVGFEVTQGGSSPDNTAAAMMWPYTPQSTVVPFATLEYASSSTTPSVLMLGARHVPLDFAYRRTWQMWGGHVDFEQRGNVCLLNFYAVHKSKNDSWYDQTTTDQPIPEWARPQSGRSAYVYTNNGGNPTAYMAVYPDGNFRIGNAGSASTTDAAWGTLMWLVM